MCEGTREDGSRIEPNDPIWDDLTACAARARVTPTTWLEMRHIYGDLANAPRFTSAFERWLTIIYSDGMEPAIRQYLEHF